MDTAFQSRERETGGQTEWRIQDSDTGYSNLFFSSDSMYCVRFAA